MFKKAVYWLCANVLSLDFIDKNKKDIYLKNFFCIFISSQWVEYQSSFHMFSSVSLSPVV